MSLYHFPKTAAFGKAVPKNKIYEHISANTKTKKLFSRNIEKIIWAYKLSTQTINVSASESVQEIQVITLTLKTPTLSLVALQTIDKAIPSPTLFELNYNGKSRYIGAYKRTSEADKSKWVVSSYFETEWFADTEVRKELPIALNMATLYHSILTAIISLPFKKGETLDQLVIRAEHIRAKERKVKQLTSRIEKEKQFNRKIDLNRSLNILKKEINELRR